MKIEFIPTSSGFDYRRILSVPTLTKLPAGIYAPRVHEKRGVLLDYYQAQERFNLPSKFYGKHAAYKKMILRALATRETSVGVLLLGEKGNGKTLLMHDLCNDALAAGHPVFVINRPLELDALREIYSLVNGECAFVFDEFDKIYPESTTRNQLLEFFSDRNIKKALFMVATNEKEKLPSSFLNRTGRFLFRIEYTYLQRETAIEIMRDFVLSEQLSSILLDYVDQQPLNIDAFVSLIREIQQFGDQVDLDLLFSVLNVPAPTYNVIDVKVLFGVDTPLPTGWSVELERRGRDGFNVVLKNASNDKYIAASLDIESTPVGHSAKSSGNVTIENGILPYPIDLEIFLACETKSNASEYRPPVLVVGTKTPEPDEHEEAA